MTVARTFPVLRGARRTVVYFRWDTSLGKSRLIGARSVREPLDRKRRMSRLFKSRHGASTPVASRCVSSQTPDQYQVEYNSRRGGEYSRFHGYTYDGIWTVALAVKHVARRIRHFHRNQTISDFRYRDVLWEKLFLDALRNTSFDGVTVSWPAQQFRAVATLVSSSSSTTSSSCTEYTVG